VSNHGGRNCDAAPASIEVLPAMVKAVGDRTTIVFDSGVRRGSDVVKALALGADLVLIGRSTLYGTAAAGEVGAKRALDIYRGEISRAMAQISCNKVSEIGPQHVAFSPSWQGDLPELGGDAGSAREEMPTELRRQRERISA
jgi:isopentenyl diphosphate isomerase/L-lactate dehydrogenase-like FMN-dependent dehydrogenase